MLALGSAWGVMMSLKGYGHKRPGEMQFPFWTLNRPPWFFLSSVSVVALTSPFRNPFCTMWDWLWDSNLNFMCLWEHQISIPIPHFKIHEILCMMDGIWISGTTYWEKRQPKKQFTEGLLLFKSFFFFKKKNYIKNHYLTYFSWSKAVVKQRTKWLLASAPNCGHPRNNKAAQRQRLKQKAGVATGVPMLIAHRL